MDVIATLAHAGFAVLAEGRFDPVEMVALRAKMAGRALIIVVGLFNGGLELGTRQTVEAVTLKDGGIDVLTTKNLFESTLDGRRTCTGRAGDCNHGVLLRHEPLLRAAPVRKLRQAHVC